MTALLATEVKAIDCAALESINAPAAETLYVRNCVALTLLKLF